MKVLLLIKNVSYISSINNCNGNMHAISKVSVTCLNDMNCDILFMFCLS